MKYSIFIYKVCFEIFIITLCLFFIGCNNSKKLDVNIIKDCDSILNGKRLIDREVPVFDISNSFLPCIDSIVKLELKCEYYNKCTSGFTFTIYRIDDYYRIQINSVNKYKYDYSKCIGVFEYDGFVFICDNLFVNKILMKTNKKTHIKYLEEKNKLISDINDRISTWNFQMINDIIYFESHHPCSEHVLQ